MPPHETDDEALARAVPPATLYKYLSSDRIDVLRNASIRFTSPLNTNDIFEVRQTFDLIAGPKLRNLFEEQARQVDIDDILAGALQGTPFAGMKPAQIEGLFRCVIGQDLKGTLKAQLSEVLTTQIFPQMNSLQAIEKLFDNMGRSLICLSLAERPDSPPMWAHYSGNSAGFVIAFDSSSPFFKRVNGIGTQGLQKIQYFDGRIPELMDDPYAALLSKQADWAYEREWRLYVKTEEASRSIGTNDVVHLLDFPRRAVQRVILGIRASRELEAHVKAELISAYPGVVLTRLSADRSAGALTEQVVWTGDQRPW